MVPIPILSCNVTQVLTDATSTACSINSSDHMIAGVPKKPARGLKSVVELYTMMFIINLLVYRCYDTISTRKQAVKCSSTSIRPSARFAARARSKRSHYCCPPLSPAQWTRNLREPQELPGKYQSLVQSRACVGRCARTYASQGTPEHCSANISRQFDVGEEGKLYCQYQYLINKVLR